MWIFGDRERELRRARRRIVELQDELAWLKRDRDRWRGRASGALRYLDEDERRALDEEPTMRVAP